MRIECLGLGLLAALLLASSSGCNKSTPDTPQPQSALNPQPSTLNPQIARVHWLGKNRIAAETNAARFLSLWNLPASARLEAQTLDKLALALTGEPTLLVSNLVSDTGAPLRATNPPPAFPHFAINYQLSALKDPLSTKLRPLLDDLVRNECYLEIQATPPGRDAASRTLSPSEGERAGERGPSSPSVARQSPSNDLLSPSLSPSEGERGLSLSPSEGERARERGPSSRSAAGQYGDAVERVPAIPKPLRLNLPGAELALAIHLDASRASLWTSNLAALFGSLTNAQSLPAPTNAHAWRVSSLSPSEGERARERGPLRLDLVRAGDWTLVGLAQEHNAPLEDFAARIQRGQPPMAAPDAESSFQMNPVTRKVSPTPGSPSDPNLWLEASLDLSRLLASPKPESHNSHPSHPSHPTPLEPSHPLPSSLPRVFFTAQSDPAGVRTRAKLDFAAPVPLELEPWNIPTNLIHDPLIGFSAIRGIRPWLTNLTSAFSLQPSAFPWTPSAFPNQAFSWAQGGPPGFHFLAVPSADASNQVYKLSELVLRDVNPILATNGWPNSAFARQTNSPGLVWRGFFFFSPTLDCADSGTNRFLFAGLDRNTQTNLPAPAALFHYLQARPNLVAYDWEDTWHCLGGWTQVGQLIRHLLCLPRMNAPENAGLAWLAALSPRLTNQFAETSVELSSPTQLSFARSSALGFTGAELQVLADWLESLQFPHGLHTFTAPLPPPPELPPQSKKPTPPK